MGEGAVSHRKVAASLGQPAADGAPLQRFQEPAVNDSIAAAAPSWRKSRFFQSVRGKTQAKANPDEKEKEPPVKTSKAPPLSASYPSPTRGGGGLFAEAEPEIMSIGGSSSSLSAPGSGPSRPPPRRQMPPKSSGVSKGANNKFHFATSMRRAVQESWSLVENNLDELGMDFFLAIFRKHPHLKELFSFGDTSDADLPKSRKLKAHANVVMKTVGVALQGLDDMEALVPVLRNLGRTHTLVGVQPADYDLIYSILIETIKKHVGPEKWTHHTEEAWELCYMSIASVMKDPSRHLQVEPVEGWGLWVAVVFGYLAVATPLEMADFHADDHAHPWTQYLWHTFLHIGNLMAALTCLLDWCSEYINSLVQLKRRPNGPNKKGGGGRSGEASSSRLLRRLLFPIWFRMNRLVRWWGLNRWAHWPVTDTLVVGSFLLERVAFPYVHHHYLFIPLWCYYSVGLVRVVAVARVVHFVRCLELLSLKQSDASGVVEFFHYARLGQLFLVMVYMIHVFGCLHHMVTRASHEDDVAAETHTEREAVNAYLSEVYWAFVNVAGIGADDTVPETSLEIVFSILVHLLGASLYAMAAGSVFAILESQTQTFNQVGHGVASLKQFMQNCDIPETTQDTFLSTFLMRNLVMGEEEQPGGREGGGRERVAAEMPTLEVPDSASTLPKHQVMELQLFSRSKAIRNRAIPTASIDFSFSLAESLTEKLTLLPGDYLFRAGDKVMRRVWMLDKGVLEVFVNGVSERCLYQGDIIGVGLLATVLSASSNSREDRDSSDHKAFMDWMQVDGPVSEGHGIAIANVRAMESCRLVMGLSDPVKVQHIQSSFRRDIERIQATCEPDEKDLEWEHELIHKQNLKPSRGRARRAAH